jgi:pimeloyl-ACP methyl ester carboxylesterase
MTFSMPRTDCARTTLVRNKRMGLSYLEGGTGVPIVLLHGIPGSAFSWAAVGERLARRHRVVIPDLSGFGSSDRPATDYYLEGQARHVRALLGSFDIGDFVLGGHDFGGPVALTMQRLFPKLPIRALVLSATNLFTDTYIPPPLRLARVPVLGAFAFAALAGNRLGLRLMYQSATRRKREVPWKHFRRHLTRSCVDLTRRIFHRSLADLKANYGAIEAWLPRVDVPTLVLWGDRDPFFDVSVGLRSHRAIPGSILRVLEDTGHFVPEERPVDVAKEILRFLEAPETRLPVDPA